MSTRANRASVIIPSLGKLEDLVRNRLSPRRKSIGSPRELDNLSPKPLVITPHTPPSDNPAAILTDKITKGIDQKISIKDSEQTTPHAESLTPTNLRRKSLNGSPLTPRTPKQNISVTESVNQNPPSSGN